MSTSVGFTQDIKYAKSCIDSLTSPSWFGRGYVQNGHINTAQFIAKEFEKSGLQAVNKQYFQAFDFPVNIMFGNLSVQLDQDQLNPGVDYLVDADAPSTQGSFELVYVSKEEALDPNQLAKLLYFNKDAFLVIDPSDFDPKVEREKLFLDDFPKVLKFLDNLNIGGAIILTEGKLTWSPAYFQGLLPIIRIQKDRFPEGAKQIHLDIDAEFRPKQSSQNVIAMIEGSEQPDSFMVFTAHYDHLGTMGREVQFPGANDNASGIAMMLNLAQHFGKPENKPKQSILFMAFSGEELGLFGSRYYVDKPIVPLANMRFLINFDILGTGDDGIMVVNARTFPRAFSLLESINEEQDLLPAIKTRGKMCKSDHCFFFENGVPAYYFYTLGGIDAYHDIYDRPETLPLTAFENIFTLVRQFVERY